MKIRNFEFKARVDDIDSMEQKLLLLNPLFKGEDHQVDTYFNVRRGRLKLREGNIENALIHYDREDIAGSKQSKVILYKHNPDRALKDILSLHMGVKAVVDKMRKIYYIDNVKFHFDHLMGLGSFVEVEAIDVDDRHTLEELRGQCDKYQKYFGLDDSHMVNGSYGDMVL
jgi:adenylate cyclase, class 2